MAGLHLLYQSVENLIKSIVDVNSKPVISHIHTWNNQLRDLEGKINQDIAIPFPAVFIELKTNEIEQMGNGNQLLYCDLRLHIVHQMLNAPNGEFEQDWEVFDLFDIVYKVFQRHMFDGCGDCILTGIEQDFDRNSSLYHLIANFKLNYIYSLADETGILKAPPFTLNVNLKVNT